MPAWADLDHLGGQEVIRQAGHRVLDQVASNMTRKDAEALAAMAARTLARLDEITERYGEDDMIDGAVLRFVRVISGRVYGYAATRAGGRWYLTGGRSPQGLTWDELTNWLAECEVVSAERLSTGFGPEEDEDK